MPDISAQERAERSMKAMLGADEASRWIGAACTQVAPGEAVMTMPVMAHHCNGHKTCHGGISYMLADTALAVACNSYNQVAVAQHNSITYLAPAYEGDVLTAHAVERARSGRSSLYDVQVANQKGEVIAEFRGGARVIRGQHFEEPTA